MTKKLYELKEKLIDRLESEIQARGGIGNINTAEAGMIIDMIKDLSEAEHHCWEACYYKSVVESMEKEGGRMGYGRSGQTGSSATMGYQGAMDYNRDMMGYQGSMGYQQNDRMGYSDPMMENMHRMMEEADPQRKEQLKRDFQKLSKEIGM